MRRTGTPDAAPQTRAGFGAAAEWNYRKVERGKEASVYIGGGLLTLLIIVVLLIWLL